MQLTLKTIFFYACVWKTLWGFKDTHLMTVFLLLPNRRNAVLLHLFFPNVWGIFCLSVCWSVSIYLFIYLNNYLKTKCPSQLLDNFSNKSSYVWQATRIILHRLIEYYLFYILTWSYIVNSVKPFLCKLC